MKCYHRTSAESASAILSDGFQDGDGAYMAEDSGVWVTDVPLDEGADGDTLLTIEVADKVFSDYEWTQADPQLRETKGYREAMIPAVELNRWRVAIVDD